MYYTYVLKNPLKENQPFYVGKGKGDRALRHIRACDWKESCSNPHKSNTIRQIKQAGLLPNIEIIPADSEEQAFLTEKQLIEKYGRRVDGGLLTNICLGGEGHSAGHRPVDQYNVYREFMHTFSSCLEAARAMGAINSSTIVGACKQNSSTKRPYGFVWCYHGDTPNWEWVFDKIKPVYQWSLDGELVARYPSLNAMYLSTGIDSSNVTKFINSSAVCAFPHGHQFSHEPVFPNKSLKISRRCRPVLCVETGEVFASCSDAERAVRGGETKAKNISAVCAGRQPSAYGRKWAYCD